MNHASISLSHQLETQMTLHDLRLMHQMLIGIKNIMPTDETLLSDEFNRYNVPLHEYIECRNNLDWMIFTLEEELRIFGQS